jgi:hypothetical protein
MTVIALVALGIGLLGAFDQVDEDFKANYCLRHDGGDKSGTDLGRTMEHEVFLLRKCCVCNSLAFRVSSYNRSDVGTR